MFLRNIHIILALLACLLVGITSVLQKDAEMKTVLLMGIALLLFLVFGLIIRKVVYLIMKEQNLQEPLQESDVSQQNSKDQADENELSES